MPGLQSLVSKALRFLRKNPDKAHRGIDRVSRIADEKTGGKYRTKIDKSAAKAKGYLGNRGGGHPPRQ